MCPLCMHCQVQHVPLSPSRDLRREEVQDILPNIRGIFPSIGVKRALYIGLCVTWCVRLWRWLHLPIICRRSKLTCPPFLRFNRFCRLISLVQLRRWRILCKQYWFGRLPSPHQPWKRPLSSISPLEIEESFCMSCEVSPRARF